MVAGFSLCSGTVSAQTGEDEAQGQNPWIWTCQDVTKMCKGQWHGPRTIESCIERNHRKIGKTKSPGEFQELEAITERYLHAKSLEQSLEPGQ
jgi:hypothetical protein